MDYIPTHGVWEITYACNMNCMHCGSGCGEKYPNELTTDEALALCDDLADLGLRFLTLSGGEPFMHKDWPKLARRLSDRGVTTNVISNGWYIDESLVDKAFEAGLVNVGVSVDGVKETHDVIRKKGSFDRIMTALDLLKKRKMPSSVNTSISNRNLGELAQIRDILISKGVSSWQFQIARPMGNFLKHKDLVLAPSRVEELINFAYETTMEGRIEVHIGDDIGYYNQKQDEICRVINNGNPTGEWIGCHAGKRVIGIRANGDIIGCLSIRDDSYIEGNVREVPLKEIWTRPGAFAWSRDFKKSDLKGFCGACQHGAKCLGGCAGTKLTINGTLDENEYCSYRSSIERQSRAIKEIIDYDDLMRYGESCVRQQNYQMADLYFKQALVVKADDRRAIDYLGFVNFFLENYEVSRDYNKKALELDPENAYACKGLGLCLSKLGKIKEGVLMITRAIQLAGPEVLDYYMDLAVVLDENRQTKEAIKVLNQARKHSDDFKEKTQFLYDALTRKLA